MAWLYIFENLMSDLIEGGCILHLSVVVCVCGCSSRTDTSLEKGRVL